MDRLTRSYVAAWYDETGVLNIATRAGKNKEERSSLGKPQLDSMASRAVEDKVSRVDVVATGDITVTAVLDALQNRMHGFIADVRTGSSRSRSSFLLDHSQLK